MAKNLDDVLDSLPIKRRKKIEQRAGELATLKDLRQAVERTQQDLAASLGVRCAKPDRLLGAANAYAVLPRKRLARRFHDDPHRGR